MAFKINPITGKLDYYEAAGVPGTHAGTHVTGGGDTIADAVAAGNSGLMSGTDKTKLDGIAAGAEVNVNADWNSGSGDSQILNKPSIPTQYTDEMAQDAVGGMADANSLEYTDGTPVLAVKRQMSITADASGIKLDGDSAAPGNSKVYGTTGAGVKGWKDDPAGGAHASSHVTGGADIIAEAVAGVSNGLLSATDKTKLDGIAAGAEVNVNADWNSVAGDSQILNKPTIPTLDYKIKVSTDDTTPNWLSSKIDAGDALSSSVSDEGANEVFKLDVATQMSITFDASGLKLSGDSSAPGANQTYGTDGSGVKGWKADPAGGSGLTHPQVLARSMGC